MRRQVKGPVQWLVSSCRVLERPLPPAILTLQMMRTLGQVVFAPPSVKGWDTGTSWISTNTLLDRYNFSALLVQGEPLGMGNAKGDVARQEKEAAEMAAANVALMAPGGEANAAVPMEGQSPVSPAVPVPPVPPPRELHPVRFEAIHVEKLFTQEEMEDTEKLLNAIQNRLIEGPLSEARRMSLRKYIIAEKPNGAEMVRGVIRLLMSTPDYQLT